MNVEQAREAFPVGQKVLYFPIRDAFDYELCVVRSEPWELGHGAVVVKVTGRAGGVLVEHLRAARNEQR